MRSKPQLESAEAPADTTDRRSNPAGAEPIKLRPEDPAHAAILAAFQSGLKNLQECRPAVFEGSEVGVHRMRTTARRIRTALRVFRPLLDQEWSRGLEAELKWLAGMLGGVRDLDVQQNRLHADAGDLAEALTPLFSELEARQVQARNALGDALRSGRFDDLVRTLADAAQGPPTTEAARESCRSALPPLTGRAWRKLKSAGRALETDSPAEAFHETRIQAKRARYSAEVISPALGPMRREAERFARRAADLQEVLGDHQDATVARSLLESIVADRPGDVPFAVAAGRMIERQVSAAEHARAQFAEVWHAIDRGKIHRWLKAAE